MVIPSKSSAVVQSKSDPCLPWWEVLTQFLYQWEIPLHAPVLGLSGKMMFQPQSLFPWWLR